MAEYEREYLWYRTGCNRLEQIPVSKEEFLTRWQEFEQYAERLKTADEANAVAEVDAALRAEMQARVKGDPFVQAILVGMAEDMPESGRP